MLHSLDAISLLPPLRDVLARHDLMAKKSLGQHFLCDLNLTAKIVECAGDLADCTVFEIGPGPGGLTRPLVQSHARKIIVVEKDNRFLPALQEIEQASGGKLAIVSGDALKTDLTTLAPAPRAVVANLPYNIGTELLINWLHQIDEYRSLTLMFQAEVVDRIVAAPNSKAYGRLAVIAQFCAKAERVMTIPARAFTPPPKIDSAIVHLTPRTDRPRDITLKQLETVTAHAFGQRRKMLRSSLKPLGGEELLKRADINPELRAENLSVDDFVRLARLVGSTAQ